MGITVGRVVLLAAVLAVASCSESGTSAGGVAGGSIGRTGGMTATGGTRAAPAAGGSGGGTGSWSAACGDITHSGTCLGNVYTWCDYWTGSVQTLDCTSLGLTCFTMTPQTGEDFENGCVGSCTDRGGSCSGNLAQHCYGGELRVQDCSREGGPGSACVVSTSGIIGDDPYVYCDLTATCEPNSPRYCDGNILVFCLETGEAGIHDCADYGIDVRCGRVGDEACCVTLAGECATWA